MVIYKMEKLSKSVPASVVRVAAVACPSCREPVSKSNRDELLESFYCRHVVFCESCGQQLKMEGKDGW